MPLHWASHEGHLKVVQFLLDHGADLNGQTKKGRVGTSLHAAVEGRRIEVVRLLVGHGADVRIRGRDDLTPFQLATRDGYHDIAQLLRDHGAEIEEDRL
jgi:ankyrin repeat protein